MNAKMTDKILSEVAKEWSNQGADSVFAKITTDVGVKLFPSKLACNRNYDRHLRFAKIAPKVGHKVTATINEKTMYGFIVEIAKVYGNGLNAGDISVLQNILFEVIADNGWVEQARDLHTYNIGETRDGRAVAIDFSRFVDDDGFMYHNLQDDLYAKINGENELVKLNDDGDDWK